MRKQPKPQNFEVDLFEDKEDNAPEPLTKSQLKNMTLLDRLECLIDLVENNVMNDDFLQVHKDLIQSLADDLVLTPQQTVLLCPYVADPCSMIDQGDLRRFFNCSAIAIMRRKDDIKALLHRRYIACCGNGFRRGRDGHYCLTEKAQKALCDNHGLPVIKTTGLTRASS